MCFQKKGRRETKHSQNRPNSQKKDAEKNDMFYSEKRVQLDNDNRMRTKQNQRSGRFVKKSQGEGRGPQNSTLRPTKKP